MNRCSWCNINNSRYVKYHDKEWGVLNLDDNYLFEMLILESFQAGLSWECVLNKRDGFKEAYDNFDLDKVCQFDEVKVSKLLNNNDELKVSTSGENIKIYVNGVLIGQVNETAYIEETKVGLQTCSLDARFDNFKVTFKE